MKVLASIIVESGGEYGLGGAHYGGMME